MDREAAIVPGRCLPAGRMQQPGQHVDQTCDRTPQPCADRPTVAAPCAFAIASARHPHACTKTADRAECAGSVQGRGSRTLDEEHFETPPPCRGMLPSQGLMAYPAAAIRPRAARCSPRRGSDRRPSPESKRRGPALDSNSLPIILSFMLFAGILYPERPVA
jgi:hypothetical protein